MHNCHILCNKQMSSIMKPQCTLRNNPNRVQILAVLVCTFLLTGFSLYIAHVELSKESQTNAYQKEIKKSNR